MRAEGLPTVSVVVCAYTEDRWDLLKEAIRSLQQQSLVPTEIILSIDHNPALFAMACEQLVAPDASGPVPVQVVENKYDGRLGSARNTGVEQASGDIVAFLDDDATATSDWLRNLTGPFEDPVVMAVGGAPHPRFVTSRPRWFPFEFDWVFGCVYRGLPTSRGPVRHVIGANMAARRRALEAIGGFHSDNHDDMDMCHRIAQMFPGPSVVFEPAAVVSHFVHPERLTWRYFWRRCFYVNKGKVGAFANMREAASLRAEIDFVLMVLTRGAAGAVAGAVKGDLFAVLRLGVSIVGITLAGLGNLAGRRELAATRRAAARARSRPLNSRGLCRGNGDPVSPSIRVDESHP